MYGINIMCVQAGGSTPPRQPFSLTPQVLERMSRHGF